jgi:hypothetical protein
MQDKVLNEIARKGIRQGEVDLATETDGASKNALKELTRRAVGLNMIMGPGGLHGSRGLSGRFWDLPEQRPLATPVQASGLPSGLAGTWEYVANQEAFVLISQKLDLTINIDANGHATGSLMFGDTQANFQTPNCTQILFANWASGIWTFANNQLNWSGPGIATVTFACTPSQNSTRTLSSNFSFPSVRLLDNNHMQLDPRALSLPAIESNDPTQLLTSITLQRIGSAPTPTSTSSLLASVLPSSRRVQVGKVATAFATIINNGTNVATGCAIRLPTDIPATLDFAQTDPNTNAVIGGLNTPVDIGPQQKASFVFAVKPTDQFGPTDVALGFTSTNTAPATSVSGLNTILLSAAAGPVVDMVALVATSPNDGILHIPGPNGAAALACAMVNLGVSTSITATANTGNASLPLDLTICHTNPTSGACISTVGPSVTFTVNTNDTPTIALFAQARGDVPFDPANNRINIVLKDSNGIQCGATSVAVTTAL